MLMYWCVKSHDEVRIPVSCAALASHWWERHHRPIHTEAEQPSVHKLRDVLDLAGQYLWQLGQRPSHTGAAQSSILDTNER